MKGIKKRFNRPNCGYHPSGVQRADRFHQEADVLFEFYRVDYCMTTERSAPRRLCHRGLLYRGAPEYLDALAAFVDEGLQAGESVMVSGARAEGGCGPRSDAA